MTPRTRCSILVALSISIALPAWGQEYLLYTPRPVSTDQKEASSQDKESVLVQEVEVQRGDTLFGLSRKFSGHGMYYPQILLFNSIENPDLIYAGKSLRIPVTAHKTADVEQSATKRDSSIPKNRRTKKIKAALKAEATLPAKRAKVSLPTSTPSTELSLSDLKTVGIGKTKAVRNQIKPAAQAKNKTSHENPATAPSPTLLRSAHKSAPPATGTASGQKLFEAAVKAYRQDDCRTALELLDRYLADDSNSLLAADANLYKAECYLKMSAQ